jgi:hypothetical protein
MEMTILPLLMCWVFFNLWTRRPSPGAASFASPSATLTSASCELAHPRCSDLAALSRLSPLNARSATREDENRIPPWRHLPPAAVAAPRPPSPSCHLWGAAAVKSATRSTKKRWLGRHDSPRRHRLRVAPAAVGDDDEEDAVEVPGPRASWFSRAGALGLARRRG